MDALDIALLVVAALAALHGLRQGAAVQVLAFAGFLAGLAGGVALATVVCPHVHGTFPKTFVALLLLLVPASLLGGGARELGRRLRPRLRRLHLASLDAAAGALLAVAGTLIVAWLFATILVNSQYPLVADQIENSAIIRAVARLMPPVPDAFASVERFLTERGFPAAVVDVINPEPVGPVTLPSSTALAEAVRADGASTVKILAVGCGELQEGSGFVVAPDLVVTNAHVVAGTGSIHVEDEIGTFRATTVLFDPEFDLAVLRTDAPLGEPPLRIDPSFVTRGTQAAVLGFPEDGPFRARRAAVLARFVATGLDIYGTRTTTRTIYELQAVVEPGNSGGPLVEPDGLVIGVVFSRSADQSDVGYALSSPGVLQRVERAERDPVDAGTGACIAG
jgi:S1-C subfamily serine protease